MSTNVDQQEIAKFSSHAEDWWNTSGSMKALHQINPLRLQFIFDHVDAKGKTILDVGCGGGILSEGLAKSGATVTGIDLAEKSIQVAHEHAKKNKLSIDYLTVSVEELVEQNMPAFDIITCFEMLEHVPSPSAIVKSCSQLLKPNGHIFFSTLNRNLKSYLFAIIGAEYLLSLLPKGTHDYEKFIKPSELDDWCRNEELTINSIKGIMYNPFSGQYSMTNDVNVNYIAHAQKTG